jgi:hypothetical protein
MKRVGVGVVFACCASGCGAAVAASAGLQVMATAMRAGQEEPTAAAPSESKEIQAWFSRAQEKAQPCFAIHTLPPGKCRATLFASFEPNGKLASAWIAPDASDASDRSDGTTRLGDGDPLRKCVIDAVAAVAMQNSGEPRSGHAVIHESCAAK